MKIAWMIDVQAPYREPMYAAMARRADFDCYFFFHEEKVRHMVWRDHPGYRSRVVRTFRVPLPQRVRRRLDNDSALLAPGETRRILDGVDVVGIPGWEQPAYLWTALRTRLRGIPYVMFYESTLTTRQFTSGPIAAVRSWVFRHAGAVVAPGPGAREAAIASGAAPDRVVESMNSVDLEAFGVRPRASHARAEGSGGPHRFAYVGQLIARKNVATLLDALAVAATDDATLEIAGDGVELEALRTQVAELGLEDRVRFLGFLEEDGIVELLARAHTVVLPSTEEVYGMTALEAHVAGCQVVVSDRAGVAASLMGAPGVHVVPPSEDGLRRGLEAAQAGWSGWLEGTAEIASPDRTADDIIRAAELAMARRGTRRPVSAP